MLLMSVSDVVFTMVPDVTNMALPYCECGLSMAKSIPGMLGRIASGGSGPRFNGEGHNYQSRP